MKLISLLKTAPRTANMLVLVATVLLLLKLLLLNRILAAPFPGAHELGQFLEAVLAAVVGAYVFYFFVVHLKEQADRLAVQPYVKEHALRVVSECRRQLQDLAEASGVELSLSEVTIENVTAAFRRISPYSDAPLLLPTSNLKANWFQYLRHSKTRSMESIRRVLDQLRYLDAHLVGLLAEVDDCAHFVQLGQVADAYPRVNNPDLTFLAPEFVNYCDLCRKLRGMVQGRDAQTTN